MASRYGSSIFCGMNIVGGGAIISTNIIGSPTVDSSIRSGLYGTMWGIYNQSSGAVTITNNTIANFLSNGSAYNATYSGTSTGFSVGIFCVNSGTNTITNNRIYKFSQLSEYSVQYIYYGIPTGGVPVPVNPILFTMVSTAFNIIAGISVQTTGTNPRRLIFRRMLCMIFY